ncbi:carbohydrate ABC transporter permease [Paenibacillus sacheonensis]|uniref:ABC transporter permease subunit n=1 Tax=Paenibacillus sacheonensis TaxID=742054 RepID=A0A7X4YPT3_9BACL|nr:carbohydrate ABC transporter permease [Paenibacillus sacheonensis]MBM7566113.1 putative aldouronate transport system permease protein [Paenibacillus sacheonensis]NBC70327.1 ABC transporter permease subunit [Paenibacillus sacheonensis]
MHYTSRVGKLFDSFNIGFLAIVAIVTIYPFWDTFVVSIIPLKEYLGSNIHIFPREVTFEAYQYLFSMNELWTSYGVTLFVTVVGTAISMFLTVTAAYALSRPGLKGSRVIMFFFVFTMMFSGGIIPTYLVVKNLGMMNSVWALIFPSALATYNLIIMKNFFAALPDGLVEAARIDGCNDLRILYKIVIPLSLPAISTITLFYAVTRWNEFFNAIFFISDKELWPLQLFLRSMLFENESSYSGGGDSVFLLGPSIKMATVMAASIPVMLLYPFFQKYFTNGVLIGAVKE